MERNGMVPQEQLINFINHTIVNISSGVFVLDRKTAQIITCNQAFAHIHGYDSSTEVKGVVYWQLLLPMDIKQPLMELKETNFFQGEIRAFTRNQNIVFIDLTLLDISGMNLIFGLIRDITEKRKNEKRLRESEAKFRALVENIQEGLMILDAHDNIIFVNPILCSSLDYTKTELIGRNLSEITYPKQFKLLKAQIGKVNHLRHLEMTFKAKRSLEKIFLVSLSFLCDSKSNYTGAIALCVDVTDHNLKTMRLTGLRENFLRMMLSETSEQLLVALGWLDILHSKTSLPDQRERVEKVVGIIEKVVNLSRQINEFAGLKSILEEPLLLVPFSEFQNNLHSLLSPLTTSKGCQIKFNQVIKSPDRIKCPEILVIAIEQVVRYSLLRNSLNIVLDINETSDNQIQIKIIDDGKAFLETPETPDTSTFLINLFLTDVLLKHINGKLSISDILPKDGLQISLTFPVDADL
ncbi:MAG: PAS domain S-box protein [Candidatus Hodarchaeota archaeon]